MPHEFAKNLVILTVYYTIRSQWHLKQACPVLVGKTNGSSSQQLLEGFEIRSPRNRLRHGELLGSASQRQSCQ